MQFERLLTSSLTKAGRHSASTLSVMRRSGAIRSNCTRRLPEALTAGLWTHTKGGFFHDGRFPTLAAVVDHYDSFFGLGLTASQKSDLIAYLKSL